MALVKYKKLVGGGMLKIVNQTVTPALEKLGYNSEEIERIVAHIDSFDTIEDVADTDGSYVGHDVHRAARVAGAAHGGQVLLSETTRALAGGALLVGFLHEVPAAGLLPLARLECFVTAIEAE